VKTFFVVVVTAVVASAGCSTSSTQAADASVDSHTRDPNANCVKPGTPNNELGVGGYCETVAQCPAVDGGIRFCSGQFGAPETAWFCTRPCATDTDCGSNEYCAADPRGVACVPRICGPADAGSATDARSD
jgi:hypothetical protein